MDLATEDLMVLIFCGGGLFFLLVLSGVFLRWQFVRTKLQTVQQAEQQRLQLYGATATVGDTLSGGGARLAARPSFSGNTGTGTTLNFANGMQYVQVQQSPYGFVDTLGRSRPLAQGMMPMGVVSTAGGQIFQTGARPSLAPGTPGASRAPRPSAGAQSAKKRVPSKPKSAGTGVPIVNMTVTENTLIDGDQAGQLRLELPGFLELEEGRHFRTTTQIAAGGGGSLYRGEILDPDRIPSFQNKSSKIIVKKLIKPEPAVFHQEIAIMYMFRNHPNIVKLTGYSDKNSQIIMPEYTMGSLEFYVQHNEVSVVNMVWISGDVARGLRAMHDVGIVHQDMKAANILMEMHPKDPNRLQAVLTDFGISNVVEDVVLQVSGFEVKNLRGLTVKYAAPEALKRFRSKKVPANPAVALKAADVYSYAVVLCFMLAKDVAWAP